MFTLDMYYIHTFEALYGCMIPVIGCDLGNGCTHRYISRDEKIERTQKDNFENWRGCFRILKALRLPAKFDQHTERAVNECDHHST